MSFNEIINSETPVLVDFYADWCGPCHAMNPIIKEVAAEAGDRARVIKIDVDKNPGASSQYGVRSIPTFMIFKKGEAVWQHIGGTSKHAIQQALELHMNEN